MFASHRESRRRVTPGTRRAARPGRLPVACRSRRSCGSSRSWPSRVAVKKTNETFDERAIPLMGVTAAFIFAAQMFNFQVIGGTSGHLLGGVLAAVLLGPWAGTLVMVAVVAVQGLVFQDGGLVVMGANIFNMGIIGTLGGYAIYRALCGILGGEQRARIPAAGVAAWLSVFAAAGAMALELGLSGTTDLVVALTAMLSIHVAHRHRRGADHDGRPRLHPGDPARPAGPARRARSLAAAA